MVILEAKSLNELQKEILQYPNHKIHDRIHIELRGPGHKERIYRVFLKPKKWWDRIFG